jgi:hypothetical protein
VYSSRSKAFVLSNVHGTVRVYTRRHINGCPLREANENHCSCPKWIYSYPAGGRPNRQAAGTPSFPEACELAQKLYKGFDPEIREARAITEPEGVSVTEAIELYLEMLASRRLSPLYIAINRTLLAHRVKTMPRHHRPTNLSLIDYLEGYNRRAPVAVVLLTQINNHVLDSWAATWMSNDRTSQGRRVHF